MTVRQAERRGAWDDSGVTIVASLSIKVVAQGPLARMRTIFARPAVSFDGEDHPLTWLRRYRFAVAPGDHEVTVYRRGKQDGAESITFTSGPAERIHLLAIFTGSGFTYELKHLPNDLTVEDADSEE